MRTAEQPTSILWSEKRAGWCLVALLALSCGLRIWLANTGGQDFWPDEARYSATARYAAWQFSKGADHEAWLALIGQADHLLFKIAGLPPAIWEQRHGQHPALVAIWFGLFSVLAMAILYPIARVVGATKRESLLAVFFAATANSLFYYSRHFFPYDLSLFFCLVAAWLALGASSWWRSLGAGLMAGLGFLAYNGYWLLGGAVLVMHVLRGRQVRVVVQRAVFAAVGLVTPIVAAILATRSLQRDLIAAFRGFAQTIVQGDFGRGWIVVWQYFWSAEKIVFVVWLLAVGAGILWAREANRKRLIFWLTMTAAIYAGLVLCSDGLRTFVVYGRTARMMVPFFCLAAAAGVESFLAHGSRAHLWVWRAFLFTTLLGASWQMSLALRQTFPGDFLSAARLRAQETRKTSSALLRVLNADRLSEGQILGESRSHTVLLERPHPWQFSPYLYEGFNEERRQRFRIAPIAMQLVALTTIALPDSGDGYPGPIIVRLKFPAQPMAAGIAEPLLTSGLPGKANFVYVRYVDADHVQIGYDCWGAGGSLGSPIEVDFGREHSVVINSGVQWSLNQDRPAGLGPLTWSRMKKTLVVAVDGKVAFAGDVPENSSQARDILVGANLAGGSTARPEFSGQILGIERAECREIVDLLPPGPLSPGEATERLPLLARGAEWEGYCGPIRLRLHVPHGANGQAEPIVVSGKTGVGDFVYVRYLNENQIKIGFDHWGVGGGESEPLSLDASRILDLVVSFGGLMPPERAALYDREPTLAALRRAFIAVAGDRVILKGDAQSHPSSAETIQVGLNTIGGSTCAEQFSGEILSLSPASAEDGRKLLQTKESRP